MRLLSDGLAGRELRRLWNFSVILFQRILVAGGLFFSLTLFGNFAAPLHAAEMQTFVSVKGGFEVRLPPGKVRSDVLDNARGTKNYMNGVAEWDIVYMVIYTDDEVPTDLSTEDKFRLLEADRDYLLKSKEAELITERRIELAGGYPGTHCRARFFDKKLNKQILIRFSNYLVGEHMYALFVYGVPEKSDSPEADEFLHSMILLDQEVFSKDAKRYTSPDGKFQIHFPFKPKIEAKSNGSRYVAVTAQGDYVVRVTDLAGLSEKNYDGRYQVLDEAVKERLEASDGKVVELVPIKQSNRYDGYALRLDIRLGEGDAARGLYRGRFLVVGDRLYEFYVKGSSRDADSKFANYFLDSFAVKP